MAIAELTRRFPNYTLVKNRALPVAQAALALQRGKAQEAIEALEVARRYESASEFRATYFRGLAYLQLKSAQQAGAEFQQILNHRGYGPLSVLYPLAQLGYARSLALTGNAAEARKAYETFLNTWKNANSDLLPLRMANREYRELTSR
jgi:tetratricopeptide (TPR) repeat protein